MATIESIKRPWIANKPERKRWAKPVSQGGTDYKFYSSSAWRKIRALKLADNPSCQYCLKKKRITPAKVVDHRVPVRFGGGALDYENLVSACDRCHNSYSGREAKIQTQEQWDSFIKDNPDYKK